MTAADNIHKIFFHCFSEKIRLDVSSESSAMLWQRIHLKHQVLFSSTDKSKKLNFRLLQFSFGALRVKTDLVVSGLTRQTILVHRLVQDVYMMHSGRQVFS